MVAVLPPVGESGEGVGRGGRVAAGDEGPVAPAGEVPCGRVVVIDVVLVSGDRRIRRVGPRESDAAVAGGCGKIGRRVGEGDLVVVYLRGGDIHLAGVVLPRVVSNIARSVNVVSVILGSDQRHGLRGVPVLGGESQLDRDNVGCLVLEGNVRIVVVAHEQGDAHLHVFGGWSGEQDLIAGFAAFGNGDRAERVAAGVLHYDAARRRCRSRSGRRVRPDFRGIPPFAPAVIVPGANAYDDVLGIVGAERDADGLNVRVVVDGAVPASSVVVAVHRVVLGRAWHGLPGRGNRTIRARHADRWNRARRRRRVRPDGRGVGPFAPAVVVPGAHAHDDALRVVGAERDAGRLNVRVVVHGTVPAPPVVVAVHRVVLRRTLHGVPRRGYRAVGTSYSY